MIILGLFGISRVDWMGWIDLAIGVVALISSGALGRTPRSTTMATQIGLGIAALVVWVVALSVGAVAWLTWWTFAFGVAFVLSSFVSRPELPTGPDTNRFSK
jgi:hypothetical protein